MHNFTGYSMQRLAHQVTRQLRTETTVSSLVRAAFGTAGLKVTYSALGFLTSLVLARWLDAAGYGTYSYALAWVVILSVPSGLGLDVLLVREVAALRAHTAWGGVRVLLHQSSRLTLLASVCVCVLAGIISQFVLSKGGSQLLLTLLIAFALVPVLNLTRVVQATMQGLNHAVKGQIPVLLAYPFLFLVLLAMCKYVLDLGVNAASVMMLSGIAAGIALGLGALLLKAVLPQGSQERAPENVSLWRQGVPLLVLLGAVQTVDTRISTLLLGALSGPDAVGVYAVASRGAEFVSFFLLALLPALAPTIASLYAAKNLTELQRVVTFGARITFALSLPAALMLSLFGYWFLWLYGHVYTQGLTVLVILSLTQLVNVAAGPVGYLLLMTGHERSAIQGIGVALVVHTILGFALIRYFGINGAAVADSSSLVIWNVLMVVLVWRRIGIHATILGRIGSSRSGQPLTSHSR